MGWIYAVSLAVMDSRFNEDLQQNIVSSDATECLYSFNISFVRAFVALLQFDLQKLRGIILETISLYQHVHLGSDVSVYVEPRWVILIQRTSTA